MANATPQPPAEVASAGTRVTIADLDESEMCDGYVWTYHDPRGRAWSIAWQPGRGIDTLRAWLFPGGRTAYRGNVATLEAARAWALETAQTIADRSR